MKTDIIRNVALGAIVVLCVGSLFISSQAEAGEQPFKLQTADRALYGTEKIDTGEFVGGADRLETMLELVGSARRLRAAALNDLCAAYTMLNDFDAARTRCNENVANGRHLGRALNNRGVLRIATGDYEGAVQDFNAALQAGGARRIATANLVLSRQRLAEPRDDVASNGAAHSDDADLMKRSGNERAAAVDALARHFARLIEADTQHLATQRLTPPRGRG